MAVCQHFGVPRKRFQVRMLFWIETFLLLKSIKFREPAEGKLICVLLDLIYPLYYELVFTWVTGDSVP